MSLGTGIVRMNRNLGSLLFELTIKYPWLRTMCEGGSLANVTIVKALA